MKLPAKRLKKVLNDVVIDLVVFGSYAKNSVKPNDIDIAAIVSEKVRKVDLMRKLETILNMKIDLQIVTINTYDKFLWYTLIREGYSVKHEKYLHEVYGLEPIVLYKYSLKQLAASKKVMFERALKKFQGVNRLSNRVVLVPISKSGEFDSLLQYWNIDFDSEQHFLSPFIRKELL